VNITKVCNTPIHVDTTHCSQEGRTKTKTTFSSDGGHSSEGGSGAVPQPDRHPTCTLAAVKLSVEWTGGRVGVADEAGLWREGSEAACGVLNGFR
jgi:hypothetical protein